MVDGKMWDTAIQVATASFSNATRGGPNLSHTARSLPETPVTSLDGPTSFRLFSCCRDNKVGDAKFEADLTFCLTQVTFRFPRSSVSSSSCFFFRGSYTSCGNLYPLRRCLVRSSFASASSTNSSFTGSHFRRRFSSRQILTRWQITWARCPISACAAGFSRDRMQSAQFFRCRCATLATSERSSGGGASWTSSGGLLAKRLRLISIFPLSPTKIAPSPGPLPCGNESFNNVPLG